MSQNTDATEENSAEPQEDIQQAEEPVEAAPEEPSKDEAETTEPAMTMLERRRRLADQIEKVAGINKRELTEKEDAFVNEVTFFELFGEPV